MTLNIILKFKENSSSYVYLVGKIHMILLFHETLVFDKMLLIGTD